MNEKAARARASQGEQVSPTVLETLRELYIEYGSMRALAAALEVNEGACARALAGGHVLRGTHALLRAGIARLRGHGERQAASGRAR